MAKAHLAIAPVTAGCQAVTAASIILTDACAPLAAIVGAWNRLATTSAAGDTLLFYYSGHGSTVIDASDTQESGSSDTLVPFDARGRGHNPELIDLDIKALIDMATARGVNVVTILDSCNSGTATRAFSNNLARAIPRGVAPRRPLPPPVGPGAHPGYRVHLSAAADSQTAVERGGHGLFTGALAAAITAAPDATYGDLITRVRATLAAEPQTAGIEGALTARFLGPPPPPGRAFTGRVAGDAVVLDFGTLSLVTTGSRFAVFASSTATAAAGAVPLTTGTIIAATTHTARLTLAGPLPAGTAQVFVIEAAHDYDVEPIRVAIEGTPAQRELTAAALAATPATLVATAPAFVVRWAGPRVRLLTATAPPTTVYDSGEAPVSAVLAALAAAMRRVADFRALVALVALQAAAGEPQARLSFFSGACTAPPEAIAPAAVVGGEPTLTAGLPANVLISNRTDKKVVFSYLFALNHDFTVYSLNTGNADIPIEQYPGRSRCQNLKPLAGRGTLLAILSEVPLDAAALAPNGGSRSLDGCAPGARDYLVCRARRGSRAFGPVASGWTATASTVPVVPGRP